MYHKIIGHIRLIEKFLSIININYHLFYIFYNECTEFKKSYFNTCETMLKF